MPLVDVTDILFDSDVAGQSFVVIRRQETVNNFGESTWVTERAPAIGSVQPKGDQELMREDAFDAQARTIIVATTFRLRGVSKGPSNERFKPDIIFWGGNYYEVTSPASWTDFGAGFIETEATAIHWVDNEPGFLPPFIPKLDFSKTANSMYAHGAGNMF
jgi:hypothetical protein